MLGTGVVMEHVEADAGVGRPPTARSGPAPVSRQSTERRRLLKLERDPHAERRGQLGGFAEARGGPRVILEPGWCTKSGVTISVGNSPAPQEREPAPEVVPVRSPVPRLAIAANLPETPPRPV